MTYSAPSVIGMAWLRRRAGLPCVPMGCDASPGEPSGPRLRDARIGDTLVLIDATKSLTEQ